MASTQFFDGPGLQILQFYVGLLKDKIRVLTTDKKRAMINYAFFLFLFTNKYPESNFPNVKKCPSEVNVSCHAKSPILAIRGLSSLVFGYGLSSGCLDVLLSIYAFIIMCVYVCMSL